MHNPSKTKRKLKYSILLAVLLCALLCVTTYAWNYPAVTVEDNQFKTGTVSIDLNGGRPVIEEHEYLFEPGMTVEKPFYVQNESTWAVYYKLYFDNVEGSLADVLQITVYEPMPDNQKKVLYQGTAASLSRQNVTAADDILLLGERRDLMVQFYYPKDSGNATQKKHLKFDFCADAVQEKNNPDKAFD